MDYKSFLEQLDNRLAKYFERDKDKICCCKGCSNCCKNADFPLSFVEMNYLMKGFLALDKTTQDEVRKNIKNILHTNRKFYTCPFLVNDLCSAYEYRPIICRVHGLAYKRADGIVNLPDCANSGLNYADNFDGETVDFEPVKEDLNPISIRKALDFGEVRPMIRWF